MDVLSGVSVEGFKILAVILALLAGVGIYFGFFRKWYWAIVGAVFVFTISTAGAGLYVLLHVNDSRWSADKEPFLEAPKVSETPFIGQYLEPLGAFLNNTANSINDFVAFQRALPIAQDYFTLALWGLVILFPVMIVALVMSRLQPLLLEKRVDELKKAVNEMRVANGQKPLK